MSPRRRRQQARPPHEEMVDHCSHKMRPPTRATSNLFTLPGRTSCDDPPATSVDCSIRDGAVIGPVAPDCCYRRREAATCANWRMPGRVGRTGESRRPPSCLCIAAIVHTVVSAPLSATGAIPVSRRDGRPDRVCPGRGRARGQRRVSGRGCFAPGGATRADPGPILHRTNEERLASDLGVREMVNAAMFGPLARRALPRSDLIASST